jgi:ankyrin repeat protein
MEKREQKLLDAACQGNWRRIKKLLNSGVDVNAKNEYGRTALHYAAYSGSAATARELLARGADVNAKDVSGWTPLRHAEHYGKIDVVRILVDAGADVNATDKDGHSVSSWLARTGLARGLDERGGTRER